MKVPRYEPCECDQALFLREAIERAWAEIVSNPTKADAILDEALHTDHHCTIGYIEEES